MRSGGRRTGRWVVLVVVALALSLVGCSEDQPDATTAGDTAAASGGAPVKVDMWSPRGAGAAAQVVTSQGSLVSLSFVWDTHAIRWSDDDGRTWQPAQLPDGDKGHRASSQLLVAGDLAFVVGGQRIGGDPAPPFIWVSADGGHSFVDGAGVAAGFPDAAVRSVVESGGRLVAFGYRGLGLALRWESSDRGRTWAGAPAAGLPKPGEFPSSVVAAGSVVLAVAGVAGPSSTLVRSTDAGRTWTAVELDGANPSNGLSVDSAGDLLEVRSFQRSWVSGDGGATWRALGTLLVTDEEGSSPSAEFSGAVHVTRASEPRMVGVVRADYGEDHHLDHLVRSDDGGSTWDLAPVGPSCTGDESAVDIAGPFPVGDGLVAIWNCTGDVDRGGRVLVSADGGGTWTDEAVPRLEGIELDEPVLTTDGNLVVLGSRNFEEGVDVALRISPA